MNLRQAAQHALEVMDDHMYRADTHEFYEAKEALRAALAEPEQPVAWYYERGTDKGISFAPDRDPYKDWQALYTAPPEAVEPIAWMVYTDGGASTYVTDNPNDLTGAYRALPLYTAPPKRKPNDAEVEQLRALNAELVEALRVAVDSDLGALWVWPASAKETWLQNARAALAKAQGEMNGQPTTSRAAGA